MKTQARAYAGAVAAPETNAITMFDGTRDLPKGTDYDVSIVIPLMNEEDNVANMCKELRAMMDSQPLAYEVLFVNDGSTDQTAARLKEEVGHDPRFTVIEFMRNFGQSAAMGAGFNMARGRIMVPMDGDLQNDPADIPSLISRLDESDEFDVICGWRKNRKDKWLSRKLPSLVANRIIRKLTYCEDIHDFGCTLKAYRREVLEDLHLYGEMHRFLPYMCRRRGARMTESVVNHRHRVAGQTKYNLKRTIKVLFDLLTAKFLEDYLVKPLYFFGKFGMITLIAAMAAVALAVVQKFGLITEHGRPVNLNDNIFILFAMMMFLTTLVLFLMGVMAELLIRIYHESQGRMPFKVRKVYRGVKLAPATGALPE